MSYQRDESSYVTSEISLSRSSRFWLLLIFEIPSLACSIFILYHLIINRNLRHALENHSIILLNITAFIVKSIDIPLYLHFIRMGKVYPSIPIHCLIWWIVDLGFYYTCCLLAAWASIERHILIFHRSWLSTGKKRMFVHYLPLIFIILYAIIYYIYVIFLLPCQNNYTYNLPVCGAAPCYLHHEIFRIWEPGIHGCLVTMIIIIFNIGLIFRVVLGKRLRNQQIEWRRYRKMTLQMLSISLVFIIFNLPISIMYIMMMCGIISNFIIQLELYFFFITYWLLFSLPFVCLHSLPNLKQKLKKFFRLLSRHQATVAIDLRIHS